MYLSICETFDACFFGFLKKLTGGWKESITYLQKGLVEVIVESWDIEALIILLQAIHS